MAAVPFHLFGKKRFLPLFITQFLGAFNDNIFKNALVILITYVVVDSAGINPQILVTLAAGIFILPYFLFSAIAGQMADKYERAMLVRRLKVVEVLLMLAAAAGFIWQSVWMLMLLLFLMGVQSCFFGPLKYSLLPQHLHKDELLAGNAMVSAGTFLAILLGTIVGGLLIMADIALPFDPVIPAQAGGGAVAVSLLTIGVAVAGWVASCRIPSAPAAAPQLRISLNVPRVTWQMLRHTYRQREVFVSIIGISWFWLVGATFLAQFPNFAKVTLHADETVVTLFLTLFSVGIGLGALLCNRLLRGRVSSRYATAGAFGIAVFTILLYMCIHHAAPTPMADTALQDVLQFAGQAKNWALLACLLGISVCGGVYVVPLYTIMQLCSPLEHRARTVAANNVMNALFMVVSALACSAMLQAGMEVSGVFLVLGVVNIPVACFVHRVNAIMTRQGEPL